jgi:hypothetical protein
MSLGLWLWTIATVLVLLFILGAGGLLHLAAWILAICIIFGLGFAAVALIMRFVGG